MKVELTSQRLIPEYNKIITFSVYTAVKSDAYTGQ